MSGQVEWGSDAIAGALRQSGVPYVALNPGASFRGLHDSLVNFLGNEDPEMLVCLHEEHAVAIAHGYAKVTGEPLGVLLHSNVGLMHASMAIFNGFCDRVPMLVIGATGPLAADSRRPWIDWIHTASDMPALVRDFVKWDDQPTTVRASVDSILRANQLTRAYPHAPTYVCVDAAVQEQRVVSWRSREAGRYRAPSRSAPDADAVVRAAELLAAARNPVVLAGRVSRDPEAWRRRIELAERVGARVVTDLKTAAAFPTDHPLHGDAPGNVLTASDRAMLTAADVLLALEWEDLGGTLAAAFGDREPGATVIAAGSEHELFNGWTKNDYALAPVDISLNCHPDDAVRALVAALPAGDCPRETAADASVAVLPAPEPPPAVDGAPRVTVGLLGQRLRAAVGPRPTALARVPTSWEAQHWPLSDPLSYLGSDGGGGVGSGPGIAVGAALALKGSGRMPIAVMGDGDALMGITALWTAARYEIPLLVVVANNGSYFNDELHQTRMADLRGRPRENAHIGMRTEGPRPDIAHMAEDMGLVGIGPVHSLEQLDQALARAVEHVEGGRPTVVDVIVERGYPPRAEAGVLNDRRGVTA
ncbi:thiamine pyrophosphate-binding protein [Blastococcus sp. CT_GayMR20]|uniref:thiamine pyrophosphate-binding protein n=1 Tax=Blastococcus sp. CT_GayMR20 TaxID=2559609 RepID=UPI001073C26A|nr:thiamine pyrophosphate-dependent enzyme [Blastococcus sp. CT_GayMR20]TFV88952.1 thiamine pyrophosphate-binding protein [Blastococcus sp. CT_GayMR20]